MNERHALQQRLENFAASILETGTVDIHENRALNVALGFEIVAQVAFYAMKQRRAEAEHREAAECLREALLAGQEKAFA